MVTRDLVERTWPKAVIAFLLGLVGCSEIPTRFLAPEVPLTLQVPLVDSTLFLGDLVEDTSQVIVEPGTGNIALALAGELSPVNLAQHLGRIEELRLERQFSVNEIAGIRQRFEEWQEPVLQTSLRTLFPGLPEPPSSESIPSTSGSLVIDSLLRLPEGIIEVAYRQGELAFVLENRYPVPVVVEEAPGYGRPGIVIRTDGVGEWFFPLTEFQRSIPAGATRGRTTDPGGEIRMPLTGVVLGQRSRIILAVSSPGSGGQVVSYTSESLFSIFCQPQEVGIEWARIAPREWTAELVLELPLPYGAELTDGKGRSLRARVEMRNDLPLGFQGHSRLGQLLCGAEPLQRAFSLAPMSSDTQVVECAGPVFLRPEPEDNGVVRTLRLRVALLVQPPGQPVVIRAADVIEVNVVVAEFILEHASGTRLPVVSFEFHTESEVWLRGNLGLLSEVEVELSEVLVEVELENSAAVGFRVEGRLEIADRNKTVMARLPIPSQQLQAAQEEGGAIVPQQTRWELRYAEVRLVNRPRFVRFLLSVHPQASGHWAFVDTSQLRGRVQVLLPLRLRAQRLLYEQEWSFTGGEQLRRQGQRVERATVVMEVKNRIPIAVHLRLVLSDTLGWVQVPPDGELFVAAAPVSPSGIAVGEQYTVQRFELDERHLPGILQANRLKVWLAAATTAQQYVRIRTSDYVSLRASLRAELSVP
ncbi:MAG: hypothetical protein NZ960_00605 [Candidatus Kapabacteria bacterium]|nr:hypothetical protein [Candidatus Kapabacteria bacterium]MDW8011527.1 hypothetical protein [Bacteroidota bacterium]